MTESKAIKQFKERIDIPDYKEQIPEYYEAMEIAINTLEKQIQKKYKEKYCIGFNTLACPVCKRVLYLYEPYCDNCGQAIDWSDEE